MSTRTKILRLRLRMTRTAGRYSRNADFIIIAAQRQSTTLGAIGAVNLKNLFTHSLRSLRPPLVLRTTFTHREACHWILSRPRAPYSTAITDSLDSQVA